MDRVGAVNGEDGFVRRRVRIETDLLAIGGGFSYVMGSKRRFDVGWMFLVLGDCMQRSEIYFFDAFLSPFYSFPFILTVKNLV